MQLAYEIKVIIFPISSYDLFWLLEYSNFRIFDFSKESIGLFFFFPLRSFEFSSDYL